MGFKSMHAAAAAALVLCCATVRVGAFTGGAGMATLASARCQTPLLQGSQRFPLRHGHSMLKMQAHEGESREVSRRSVLSALALMPLAPVSRLGAVAEEQQASAAAAVDPEEIVVQGETRFETGGDSKFVKAGGKGTLLVTLRVVGKGIISETKYPVTAADFPEPGKPPKGKEVGGGVPFVVKVKDLREKTDKGRTVTKEGLWGDDDIFVRLDLLQDNGKKLATGLGKAKYSFDTKKHATSFVLLE